MPRLSPRRRGWKPGVTLVELLLFMAVIAAVGISMLPLLFASTENRLLQQTISLVEQNGTQLIQNVGLRVRNAERILDPPAGATGSVLALQTGTGATDPTIIGVSSGSLIIIRRTIKQTLSSSQVAIQDFEVRNTSVADDRPSVLITFRVSRTIRLQAPRSYEKAFQAVFTLFPVGNPQGNACDCPVPRCSAPNVYAWNVCEGIFCPDAQTQLDCP